MEQIVETLLDGATYAGSFWHSSVNYVTLLLCILPQIAGSGTAASKNGNYWIWALVSGLFLQVALWFLAHAIGISIIWSVLAGFNLLFFLQERDALDGLKKGLFWSSFLVVLATTAYYFITLPLITTIAHVVGFAAGMGIWKIGGLKD